MVNRIKDIAFRGYNKIMQKNSNLFFRGILKTAPIETNSQADTILYCALDRPNCRAFILAAKSFLRYHSNISVVVQDDGSLDERCIREIRAHIKGATIYSKAEMFELIQSRADERLSAVMPAFSEYETCIPLKIVYLKLLNVTFRFQQRKVILIDSDLLFLRRPDEVIEWIINPYQRDFYGEGSNACAESYHRMGFKFEQVDVANFSSGFIGLMVRSTQEELAVIFERIRTFDPTLFRSWEIEQALWSILFNTGTDPLNLDELREVYIGSGWRTYKELRDKAVLAHFAGAFRFKNLRYLRLADIVMRNLPRYD